MFRSSLLFAFVLFALPWAALPVHAADPVLAFDTGGGDAWSFTRHVAGRAAPGACDGVLLRSPAAEVRAWFDGRRFEEEVPLAAGTNAVTAVCLRDGREAVVSAPQVWTVRLVDRPKAWIRTHVSGASVWFDAGRTERAPGLAAPIVRYEWSARLGNPAPLALDSAPMVDERIEIPAPPVDGEYFVTLRATDALGRSDESTALFRVVGGRPVEVDPQHEHPAWVDDAVVYGVNTFFFGPRGFADVAARLDALAALGATVLWLSPVTAAAPGDFGYAVVDHFGLRETFGTAEELRALIAAAHARGLKIILDFVPNHVAQEHPYHADAEARGPASPYYRWFDRDADGNITGYFDWSNLKNLDYDNPEVQAYVIAAFAHWMRAFGVDGFRVDANWAVRERAPEFWARWRAELKRINPDVFLLAEASARDPYHVRNGFDAAYDWTKKPGEWAWREAFGEGGADTDLARLRAALTNDGAGFPDDTLIFRFLNNNDTGTRFATRHGLDRTRVAAALLLTLPGVPLIYTGDEVGAAFEPYDEGPPLDWRDPHDFRPFYTRLTALRRAVPALRSPDVAWLCTTRDDALLAYLRPGPTPAESVLALLNFSGAPVAARLRPSERLAPILASGRAEDLMAEGISVEINPADPIVELPPYGIRLLHPLPPG